MSNIILSIKPVFGKNLLKTGLLLLISFAVFAQKGKTLIYDNQIYEPYIKTPLLYPFDGTNNVQATLNPPVISLNNNQNLKLEFDCLNPAVQNFRVKIFHCNADWQPSTLNEIEYLSEYNDIPIYDYYNSFATKIQFNHFKFFHCSNLAGNRVRLLPVKVFVGPEHDDHLFAPHVRNIVSPTWHRFYNFRPLTGTAATRAGHASFESHCCDSLAFD